MPELPEVEHAAKRLRQAVLGRTIDRVQVLHRSLARSLGTVVLGRLKGRRITTVARRAKMQLVTLDDGQVLEVHFRMTGDWVISRNSDDAVPYERLCILCTDGTRVSLSDSRALSVVRVHEPGQLRLPKLGPEPLEAEFTIEVLADALAKRRGPIKPTLLDQSVVAGIGNIYAAEALWHARIHPSRRAASLSRPRVAALRDAVRDVLNAAIGERYYARNATADANDVWHVYDREGEPCTRCGSTIRRITQAGRSTYYCGGCQR